MNLEASLAAFDRQDALPGGIKIKEDLERFDRIIEATKPDLLIETGTWKGASARWFAERVGEVVTIDVAPLVAHQERNILFLSSDSTDSGLPFVVPTADRRMVVLDSDHSTEHVAKELALWAPLVTPGCYLVVEDTLCHWVGGWVQQQADPWVAVEAFLWTEEGTRFAVDQEIEDLYPATMNPGGWLRAVR